MKNKKTTGVMLTMLLLAAFSAQAVTCSWTNTAGGNWSQTNNWNPNQIPGPNDTAVLPDVGNSYVVTLDVAASLSGLVVGATNGANTQTLNTVGQYSDTFAPYLTVNGVIQVNSQGAFNFNGGVYGVFTGTNVLVGTLTWSGGFFEAEMTVNTNSVLNIAVADGNYVEWAGLTLTNNGTVNWTNTTIYSGYYSLSYVYNYGLWNEQSDDYFYGDYGGGATVFNNYGAFLKSGNEGTTTLDANVTLNNTGTVNVQSGTLEMDGGGAGNGSFDAATNADLAFGGGYDGGNFSTNSGNLELTGGTLTANGPINAQNVSVSGGTSTITGLINAQSVDLSDGTLTVNGPINAQSVNVSGGSLALNGVLTSTTIQLTGGTLAGTSVLVSTLTLSAGFLEGVVNSQSVNVSGGTTTVTGTINAQSVNVSDGTPTFNGPINAQSVSVSGGVLALNGVLTSTNVQVAGTYTVFTGTNVLVGTLTLNGGFLEGVMTVSTNSVLNIAVAIGNYVQWAGLTLTNNGTVNWTNTTIYSGYYSPNYVYNYGLWNEQSDDYFYGDYEGGTTVFDNFGTFLKSGNAGTTTFDPSVTFNNTGTVDAESGTLSLNSYNLTGGALNFGISSPTSFGQITLSGEAPLTGTLSATLQNGFLPTKGEAFTVLSYPSSTGAFSCLSLELGGGLLLQPTFSGTGLTLTVATYMTTASEPQLFISASLHSMTLQWPPDFAGWTLQSTTNLATPLWTPVSETCDNEAVVPVAASQQYFRLHHGN